MENNIFEKLTPEERDYLWMYMIFNRDKIIEKTEQWTKEAEEAGMTLTEYLESISPLKNCQSCKYYKDGYCENLELKPCYPQKGCDYFSKCGVNMERCGDCKYFRKLPIYTSTIGKCIQHTDFYPKGDWYCADFEPQESEGEKKPSLWWKCERCGKLIPYMADFCHECAYELLGEPPKPFEPPIENEKKCDTCKHKNDPWDTESCDSCCGAHCGYEKEE